MRNPRRRLVPLAAATGLSGLVAAFLVIGSGRATEAQTPRPENGQHQHDLRLASEFPLAAEPESEVSLAAASMYLTAEGHMIVGQERRSRARREQLTYGWVIDLSRLTYRTFRIRGASDRARMETFLQGRRQHVRLEAPRRFDLAAGELRPLRVGFQAPREALSIWSRWLRPARRASTNLAATGLSPSATAVDECTGLCNCCPTCECGGWWSATGDILDPIPIPVSRTYARIGWTSMFSRPECNECELESWTIASWPDDCRAFAPTLAGTNWYRAACVYEQQHWPYSDRFGYTHTRGLYWNDDFPPSFGQRVWVDHTVYVWVNGSENGAGEWHEFSGAWTYHLLHAGIVQTSGANWCQM